MIANMPIDTFILYVGVFFIQFIAVVAYGVWWALQKDRVTDNSNQNTSDAK